AEAESEPRVMRPGVTVRVKNFPAPDVNGCIGIVRGFDAGSGRYQVNVEMRTGETVPMSLREEYMAVEADSKTPEGGDEADAAPPPLPGAAGPSQALRKSAADALRRFGGAIAQQAVMP
ncbi:unnamed protein product, partial [Polarella glacialis]